MNLIQRPSPNHSVRMGRAPDMIVNHITAGDSASSALNWLTNPASGVSAHFLVDKDGTTYQFVPLDRQHIVGHCELVPKWKPGCPGASFPYSKIIQWLLNAPVRSDTTDDVALKPGARYTCKLTAPVKPDFTVGNGGVLKTQYIRNQNTDEFLFSVVATGNVGDGTGVYANGKRMFGVKIA